MGRYPRECSGITRRLLSTAGVCDQRLGVAHKLLPIAGVKATLLILNQGAKQISAEHEKLGVWAMFKAYWH